MKDLRSKVMAISAVVLLAACGSEEEGTNPTQVAAKVNNNEITVHQVNQVLGRTKVEPGASTQEMANRVLDSLINQRLLEQKAIDMKLHRNPEILSKLEAARQQILVEAYLQRTLLTPTVEDSAIRDYYDANPKLFKNRRLFNYTQVLVAAGEDDIPQLIDKVNETKDIQEFINFTTELKLPYKADRSFVGTDALPRLLIEPMYTLSKGDLGFLTMSDGLLVVALHDVSEQPVDFTAAKPLITNYLRDEKRKELVNDVVEGFRKEATIEYIGDFAAVSESN